MWWILLGALALAFLGILTIPEPAIRIPGALASLRPRVSIPRNAKRSFVAATPCLVAVWALAGYYLSLGPSIFSQVIGSRNELWGGVMIFLLTGLGAASAVVFRTINPPTAMLIGCICLLVGATTTVFAIATATTITVLIAASVSGVGFGTAFMGAFRTLTALAGPNDRAGLVAAIYTVTYIAFSVPALIAGVAVAHYGLHGTALVYSRVDCRSCGRGGGREHGAQARSVEYLSGHKRGVNVVQSDRDIGDHAHGDERPGRRSATKPWGGPPCRPLVATGSQCDSGRASSVNTTSFVLLITGLHTPLWKMILFPAVLVSLVLGLLLWPQVGMLLEDRRQARSAQEGNPEDTRSAAPLRFEPPLDVAPPNEEKDDVLTHLSGDIANRHPGTISQRPASFVRTRSGRTP